MTQAASVFVYGDLNCPFCFALHERLAVHEAKGMTVGWRFVEHAPEMPIHVAKAKRDELRELETEMVAIAQRAPDVVVNAPPFRPCSGPGIALLAEALRQAPQHTTALRRSLFRALWRDGSNIADPDVLAHLADEAGLGGLRSGHRAQAQAAAWTDDWRTQRYDRIPTVVSQHGATLLGLPTAERLDLFLRSGHFGSRTDDVCRPTD